MNTQAVAKLEATLSPLPCEAHYSPESQRNQKWVKDFMIFLLMPVFPSIIPLP
jgi:hypothetical protein